MFSSNEIQDRVINSYIERVEGRLKRMRKQLVDRNWTALKSEANHLAEGATNFGYPDLANEVGKVLEVLNTKTLTRASIDSETKVAMEQLFQSLDRFVVKKQLP